MHVGRRRDVDHQDAGGGPHTVDGSSCSGLSPSDPNYPLAYAGATNGYRGVQRHRHHRLTTSAASQAYGEEQGHLFTATVDTGNGESLPAAETVTIDVGTTSCLATLTPNATGGQGGCRIGATDLGVGGTHGLGRATAVTATCPARARPPPRSPYPRTPPPSASPPTSASQAYGAGAGHTFTATVNTGNGEAAPGRRR